MVGKTKSGFEYEISEEAMDDMELLECLQLMDEEGKFWVVGKCLNILFGEEQRLEYYNFLREKHGRVPVTVVAEDIGGIFSGDDLKNS